MRSFLWYCLLSSFIFSLIAGCNHERIDDESFVSVIDQFDESTSIRIVGGKAILNEGNSAIALIGNGPDGRIDGDFSKFGGQIEIAGSPPVVTKIKLEVKTDSLLAADAPLTGQLQSAEFFNVHEHPLATFESTNIETSGDAFEDLLVTGKLTLRGTTKEIRFPARVRIDNNQLSLNASLKIDRTEFGIDGTEPAIDPELTFDITVGDDIGASSGRGNRGGGRGDGRGFDPVARFAEWDTDGDGKLAGEEIPERMRENLAEIDQDGDEAITLEEFQARMRQFRGGGRSRPGGQGGPGGGRGRPEIERPPSA